MAPFHIEKPVTLTIEQEDGATLRYVTPNLIFHTHNGRYNELTATHLTKLSYEPPKEAPVPTEAPAPKSGLTNEQETALHNVLQTAKIIERGKFNAARAIERAVAEAEATRQADEHQFNLAVLTAMHEGITQEDVELHLMGAGFSQLEEKVDSIHMLDTVMLYETEA